MIVFHQPFLGTFVRRLYSELRGSLLKICLRLALVEELSRELETLKVFRTQKISLEDFDRLDDISIDEGLPQETV